MELGEIQIVAYYGHPGQRARTVEDLRTIETYALISRRPILVMGDFNLTGNEFEGVEGGLCDVGRWWAEIHEKDEEPTYIPTGKRPTRIDRIWMLGKSMSSTMTYKIDDEIGAPGHRAVCLDLNMAPVVALTAMPGPLLKDPEYSNAAKEEKLRRIQAGWELLCRSTTDLDARYGWWAATWETYLQGEDAKKLHRNKEAALTQEPHTTWRPQITLKMRRLRNYIALLHAARVAAMDRREAHGIWKRIRSASFYMAAQFGAPNLRMDDLRTDNCVEATLEQMGQHFEEVYKAEAKQDRDHRRQDYLIKLHAQGGVNSTVKSALRTAAKEIKMKDSRGKVQVQCHIILEEAAREWAQYYDAEPAQASERWMQDYLKVPQRPVFNPGPITAEHLQATIDRLPNGKAPGPDSWRYEELRRLPPPLSFLSLFFWNSLFFPLRGIPWFFERFPVLFQGF